MISVTEVTQMMEHWSGPMPKPEDLAKYDAIVPGSGERILRMAEAQATHVQSMEATQLEHRKTLETKVVTGTERRANIGQWTAFTIAIGGILAGCYIATAGGAPTQGAAVVTVTFGGGALVWFLGGRPPKQRKEDAEE